MTNEGQSTEEGQSPNVQMYRIGWRRKVDGRSGFGKKILPEAEALELCAELNVEHPEFEHWVEEAL